jgi:hypothetical protein
VPRHDDVELARVDAGHHLDELGPRLAAQRRDIVVGELGGDGPAARLDQPVNVLALAVDAEPVAVAILALTEVDSGSHATYATSLSTRPRGR